jgi:hypothetical protein
MAQSATMAIRDVYKARPRGLRFDVMLVFTALFSLGYSLGIVFALANFIDHARYHAPDHIPDVGIVFHDRKLHGAYQKISVTLMSIHPEEKKIEGTTRFACVEPHIFLCGSTQEMRS